MTTKNPRINITLEKSTVNILAQFADHEEKSISSIAKELVLEALERREDMVLATIAKARDLEKAKRIKHKDAWK